MDGVGRRHHHEVNSDRVYMHRRLEDGCMEVESAVLELTSELDFKCQSF